MPIIEYSRIVPEFLGRRPGSTAAEILREVQRTDRSQTSMGILYKLGYLVKAELIVCVTDRQHVRRYYRKGEEP